MELTRVDRERINDSRLKIRSASHNLSHVDPGKVPDYKEIQSCLDDVEKSLGIALDSEEEKKKL